MNCDEVLSLRDPYLDSELDAKATIELEQHLKTCPACTRAYSEAQNLETLMKAGLNRGPTTAALWARIEHSVLASAPASTPSRSTPDRPDLGHRLDLLLTLGRQLQATLRHSRGIVAGMAAVWGVILVLHFSAREVETPLLAQRAVPSVAQLRLALQQKQMLMTELVLASSPASAAKVETGVPGPRSDRRSQTSNT